jgi:hypothetical protein
MLTLFSVPKPFLDKIGEIQRRSLESWTALEGVQIVLLGDEEGVGGAACAAGVEHVPELERTERGTPRLDSAFREADSVATQPFRCFVHADVLLQPDLLTSTRVVAEAASAFLLVGQTREEDGRLRGAAALDWFVFPAGLFGAIPPFAVGRACFDNWLIWKGRQEGIVVDATRAVVAVHQRHGYDHLVGGKQEAYYGEEAARNLELAGGKSHLYTIHDASHVLVDGRLRRNLGATLRARETLRKAAWKLGVR